MGDKAGGQHYTIGRVDVRYGVAVFAATGVVEDGDGEVCGDWDVVGMDGLVVVCWRRARDTGT